MINPLANRASLENARVGPGTLMHFLAKKEDTGGEFALIEAKARQGMEPNPHFHLNEDESFYILSGKMWFKIGEEDFEVGPGDLVFMPRGVLHQMKLLTETIHVLLLISPAGLEDFFWQLTEPAESLEIPPMPSVPPTPEFIEFAMGLNKAFGIRSGLETDND